MENTSKKGVTRHISFLGERVRRSPVQRKSKKARGSDTSDAVEEEVMSRRLSGRNKPFARSFRSRSDSRTTGVYSIKPTTAIDTEALPSYVASVQMHFDLLDILDNKPSKGVVFLVHKRRNWQGKTKKTVLKVFPKTNRKVVERRRCEADSHFQAAESRHPHIAAFVSRHEFVSTFCIQMEYCTHGDLSNFTGESTQIERMDLLRQIASALHHLHQNLAMIHADIKPGNVGLCALSSGQLIAKLIDFGSARRIGRWIDRSVSFGGTLHYKAPETFGDPPSTIGKASRHCKFFMGPELDMWGLGIIAFFLFSGEIPWLYADMEDKNFRKFNNLIHQANFRGAPTKIRVNRTWKKLPSVFHTHLIPGLLNPNPEKRYSAELVQNVLEQYMYTKSVFCGRVDGVKVFYSRIRVASSLSK